MEGLGPSAGPSSSCSVTCKRRLVCITGGTMTTVNLGLLSCGFFAFVARLLGSRRDVLSSYMPTPQTALSLSWSPSLSFSKPSGSPTPNGFLGNFDDLGNDKTRMALRTAVGDVRSFNQHEVAWVRDAYNEVLPPESTTGLRRTHRTQPAGERKCAKTKNAMVNTCTWLGA